MKTLATLSILIVAVLCTSCDETKKAIDVAASVELTGSYTVSSLNGNKLENTTKPTITLSALDNSFRGTTGCNSAFGSYSLNLNTIDFSQLAVSEKMCIDNAVMKTERDFLDALNNTATYTLENNVLKFYSKTDNTLLLSANKDLK